MDWVITYKINQFRGVKDRCRRFASWVRETRVGKVLTALALIQLLLWTAGPAVAGELGDNMSPANFMTGFQLEDSHGVKLGWFFDLDIDEGGATNWTRFFAYSITNFLWIGYLALLSMILVVAKEIFTLGWLDWLDGPIETVAGNLEGLIQSISWVALFGVIAVIIAAMSAMKGSALRSIGQIIMAMVVAALATGVLANPVQYLTGEDGMLKTSQKYGSEAAVMLVDPDAAAEGDSDLNVEKAIIAPLIDIFARQPHQVISFGQIVDGTKCEKTYDENVQGDDDKLGVKDGADPRGPMGKCHKPLKEWADNTNMVGAGIVFMMLFGASALHLFLSVLLIILVWSALQAFWEAIKLMWNLPLGTIAPGARGNAWKNVAHAGLECLYVVLFLVFIAAYINLVRDFLEDLPTGDFMTRLMATSGLLMFGALIAFIMRRRLKKQGNKIGDALNKMTGGGPAPAPVQASGFKAMAAVEAAKGAVSLFSKFNSGRASTPPQTQAPVSASRTSVPSQPSGPTPNGPPAAPTAPTSGPNSPVSPSVTPATKTASPQAQQQKLDLTVGEKASAETSSTDSTEKSTKKTMAKAGRGLVKTADITGKAMTVIPVTAGAGKVVTTVTSGISAADRVNQRLKQSSSGSGAWPAGSRGAHRARQTVSTSSAQRQPQSRQMDSMDRELQKLISDAASKSTPPPVKSPAKA